MDQWRVILADILARSDAGEKRRIAKELGVLSLRTLDRWADGYSTPKNSQIIVSLCRVVPFYQQEMQEALRTAFPETFQSAATLPALPPQNEEKEGIPAEFVWRILHAYSTTQSTALRQWTVANLVTEQVLLHLDADGAGMGMVFARFLPTGDIQMREGGGSGLWTTRQLLFSDQVPQTRDAYPHLLQAFQRGIPYLAQVHSGEWPLPELHVFFHWEEINAVAIYPVQRAGKSAGALLLCAREEDFFFLKRQLLLDRYAQLYALAYTDREFSIEREDQ